MLGSNLEIFSMSALSGHDSPAFNLEVPAKNDLDRIAIRNVLLLQNPCSERVLVICIEYRYGPLHDDRSVIEFFVDEMDCASRDSDTICEGLFLGF